MPELKVGLKIQNRNHKIKFRLLYTEFMVVTLDGISRIDSSKIPEPRFIFYLIGFINFILVSWVVIGVPVALVFFILGLRTKDPIQRKVRFRGAILGVSGVLALTVWLLLAMVLLSIPGFSRLLAI